MTQLWWTLSVRVLQVGGPEVFVLGFTRGIVDITIWSKATSGTALTHPPARDPTAHPPAAPPRAFSLTYRAPGISKRLARTSSSSRNGGSPMTVSTQRIHGIIHLASASAAAVGAGLAQLPCADSVPITKIQTVMIISIAVEHGFELSRSAALSLLSTALATMAGRGISQVLLGWIPGYGNALNAATAAAVTEAVGWFAHTQFAQQSRSRLSG